MAQIGFKFLLEKQNGYKLIIDSYYEANKTTYSFFDRYVLIYTVVIVEINIFHLQTRQTSLTAEASIFRSTFHYDLISHMFDDSEFCSKLNLFSRQLLQCLQNYDDTEFKRQPQDPTKNRSINTPINPTSYVFQPTLPKNKSR